MTDRVHISPRLHLQLSSEHVILYTFNGEAIFFKAHPYIWSTTVLHDTEDYVHIMVPSQDMAYKSVSHYEYEKS